jgi:D-3-phosphoglycerate dehydrogenase
MTIDLMEGKGTTYNRVSVRGTIAEGKPMVSRINDFDRLYFEPRGHSLFVVYHDQPGMIARIASTMARHEINIDDIRSPHDPKTGDSLAVLKVNKAVPQEAIDDILSGSGFKSASYLHI